MDSVKVVVNAAPLPVLKHDKSACRLQAVSFDASGSSDPDGDLLTYQWDFGDGTVLNSGSNATHAYSKGGRYMVKVTVNDGQDCTCSIASESSFIDINTPPTADAGTNRVCCVNAEAVFDGSGSFDPDSQTLAYEWDFGDGETAQGARVTHAYKAGGNYVIVLKVDDNSGTGCSSSSEMFVATVNDKPVAVIQVR
jgi:PKD repeat protein